MNLYGISRILEIGLEKIRLYIIIGKPSQGLKLIKSKENLTNG